MLILDPDKAEFQTLAMLTLLFIASIWLFLGILQDVVAQDPLVRADTALYSFLQTLRTSLTDQLMVGIIELSGYDAGLLVAAGVLIALLVRRCWRTAGWWVVTVGIAAALSPVVEPGGSYVRPLNWHTGVAHAPLPDGHATFTLLVYGFLCWLLVGRQAPLWRNAVMVIVALWVTMTGFARLYLGEDWLAGVLGGWSLGLAWFAVVAGTYTYQQVRDDLRPKILACVTGGVIVIFGAWAIPAHLQTDLARYSPETHETALTLNQWTDGGWRALPARRSEISGDEEEKFPLQWAASDRVVTRQLESAGWQAAPAWSVRSALQWLLPKTSIDTLPVLPKFADGTNAQLTFVKFDAQRSMTRWVVRLWRSRYRVMTGSDAGIPVWYGALYQEAFSQPWHLVTLGTTTNWPDPSGISPLLPAGLRTLSLSIDAGSVRHALLVLPTVSAASPH